MKILYISNTSSLVGSGAALFQMIQGIMGFGHQVKVITPFREGPLVDKLQSIGCPCNQVDILGNVYPNKPNLLWSAARLLRMCRSNVTAKRRIAEIIREFQPDIVHTNVGPISVALDVCKEIGIPHVWHHREYTNLYPGLHYFPTRKKFFEKTRYSNNYNICITNDIFHHIQAREDRDVVIYDGVFSRSQWDRSSTQEKMDYIQYTGRIEEGKGLHEVLFAFSQIHALYPNLQLKVAGGYTSKSKYYQKCLKLISQFGLQDSVQLLGQRNDVFDLMASARMNVVNSRFEGFGFITAEAMLNRCPVVGRDSTGTKEQFDKGLEFTGKEIGYRFHTIEELVEAMKRALQDDTTEMCQRAFETVCHFYDSATYASQVNDYYHHILYYVEKSK